MVSTTTSEEVKFKFSNRIVYPLHTCYCPEIQTTFETTSGQLIKLEDGQEINDDLKKQLSSKVDSSYFIADKFYKRGIDHARKAILKHYVKKRKHQRRPVGPSFLAEHFPTIANFSRYKQDQIFAYCTDPENINLLFTISVAWQLEDMNDYYKNEQNGNFSSIKCAYTRESYEICGLMLLLNLDYFIKYCPDRANDEYILNLKEIAQQANKNDPVQFQALTHKATLLAKQASQSKTTTSNTPIATQGNLESYVDTSYNTSIDPVSVHTSTTEDATSANSTIEITASTTANTLPATSTTTKPAISNCTSYTSTSTSISKNINVGGTASSGNQRSPSKKGRAAGKGKSSKSSKTREQLLQAKRTKQSLRRKQYHQRRLKGSVKNYILHEKRHHSSARKLREIIAKEPYVSRIKNVGELIILSVLISIGGLSEVLGNRILSMIALIASFITTNNNSVNEMWHNRYDSIFGDIIGENSLYEVAKTFANPKVHLGVQAATFKHCASLYPDSMLYAHIDGTNFSKNIRKPKEDFHTGLSKSGKYEPIINQTLITNSKGIIVQSTMSPGNVRDTSVTRRLIDLFLESFKTIRPRIIFTSDAGIANQINRSYIDHKGDYYVCAIACRGNNCDATIRDLARSQYSFYKLNNDISVKTQMIKRTYIINDTTKCNEEITQLLSYSRKYAERESYIRSQSTRRDSFKMTETRFSITAYYDLHYTKGGTQPLDKNNIEFKLNDQLIKKKERYDGFHALESNIPNITVQEMLDIYKLHAKIEKIFSFIKSLFNTNKLRHIKSENCFGKCNLATLLHNSLRFLELAIGSQYKLEELCNHLAGLQIIRHSIDTANPEKDLYKFNVSRNSLKFYQDIGLDLDDQLYTLEEIIDKLLEVYPNLLKRRGIVAQEPDYLKDISLKELTNNLLKIHERDLKRVQDEKDARARGKKVVRDMRIDGKNTIIIKSDTAKTTLGLEKDKSEEVASPSDHQSTTTTETTDNTSQGQRVKQEQTEATNILDDLRQDRDSCPEYDYNDLTLEDFDEMLREHDSSEQSSQHGDISIFNDDKIDQKDTIDMQSTK